MANRQKFITEGQAHAEDAIEHDNQACITNKKEDFVAAKNSYVQAIKCFSSTLQLRLSDDDRELITTKLQDYAGRAELMKKYAEGHDNQDESMTGPPPPERANTGRLQNEGQSSTQGDAQQTSARSVLLQQAQKHIESAREHEYRSSTDDDTQRYMHAKDEYLNAARCLMHAKNYEPTDSVKAFLHEEAAKHADRAEFVAKWFKAYGMYQASGDTSFIILEGDMNAELALTKDRHACMGNHAKPYGEAKELYSRASKYYSTALRYVKDGQVRRSVANKNRSCLQRVMFLDERMQTLAGGNSTDITELLVS